MQAIQRIFRLRRYNGCIKFVAAPGYETFGEPIDVEGETIDDVKSNFVQHKGYCGPTFHMKDFNRKIEGPFVSIWLHNVPWGGEDALAAPDAKVRLCFFARNLIIPILNVLFPTVQLLELYSVEWQS